MLEIQILPSFRFAIFAFRKVADLTWAKEGSKPRKSQKADDWGDDAGQLENLICDVSGAVLMRTLSS